MRQQHKRYTLDLQPTFSQPSADLQPPVFKCWVERQRRQALIKPPGGLSDWVEADWWRPGGPASCPLQLSAGGGRRSLHPGSLQSFVNYKDKWFLCGSEKGTRRTCRSHSHRVAPPVGGVGYGWSRSRDQAELRRQLLRVTPSRRVCLLSRGQTAANPKEKEAETFDPDGGGANPGSWGGGNVVTAAPGT